MGHFLLVEHGLENIHDIVGIFVQAVVAAVHVVGLGTVVIHGQAAAQVKIPHGGPFRLESPVETGRFENGLAHVPDVGNLGGQVKVKELQAVQLAHTLEPVHRLDDLGAGQAEEGPVPAGFAPVAARLNGELETHPPAWALSPECGIFP